MSVFTCSIAKSKEGKLKLVWYIAQEREMGRGFGPSPFSKGIFIHDFANPLMSTYVHVPAGHLLPLTHELYRAIKELLDSTIYTCHLTL